MACRGQIFTEGLDDAHVIFHVLRHYGWPPEALAVGRVGQKVAAHQLEIRPLGGDDVLMRVLSETIQGAENPVAFVIDADEPNRRWAQLAERFRETAIALPAKPLPEGFLTEYSDGHVRVNIGLWMMPDNGESGGLEEFLAALTEEGDPIYAQARSCTEALIEGGHTSFEERRAKAILRAYLAWQEEPGCAYGVAVGRKYFNADQPSAAAFALWCHRVFGPPLIDEPGLMTTAAIVRP